MILIPTTNLFLAHRSQRKCDQATAITVNRKIYDLPITVTWSSRVRAQFVSISAASAHLHHQCGTTFRLN